jgi:hypothetical protein
MLEEKHPGAALGQRGRARPADEAAAGDGDVWRGEGLNGD